MSVHTDCEFCVYVRVHECVKMFVTSVIEYVANTTRALPDTVTPAPCSGDRYHGPGTTVASKSPELTDDN